MKSRPLLFALVSLPFVTAASGASLTWDGATSAFWNIIDANWSGSLWNSATPDEATFGATGAGTVTIGSPGVTAGAITFSENGYLIDGDILTLGGATTTVTTATGVSATISAPLAGSASLVKTGTGTLTLSNTNTYTGKTTINGGTLSIAADSGLGTAPGAAVADQLTINGGTLAVAAAGQSLPLNRGITIGAPGATFDVSALATSATTTLSGIIAGSGPLTLKSSGDTSASGGGATGLGIKLNNTANTFTGDVTITSGLVSYAGEGSFGNSSNKIIFNGGGLLNNTSQNLARNLEVQAGGGLIRLYGSVNATYSGTLTGSGILRHTDGGTLTLSGNLTGYSGSINNQAGTLAISVATATSLSGAIIQGTGTLNKAGSGTLTLTGATTFSGALAVKAGTLKAGVDSPFNNTTSFAMSGGTLDLNGHSVTVTNPGGLTGGAVVSNTASATMAALNVNLAGNWNPGWITGGPVNANLKLTGTGVTPSKYTASPGHNSWTAMTLANAYTYKLPSDNTSAAYTLNGLGGITHDDNLTIPSTSTLALGGTNNFLAVTAAAKTLTMDCPISGTGSVDIGNATAANAGTVKLTNDNTYSGATTLNGGVLTLDYSGHDGSKLSDTGVLNLNAGTLTLANGSHAEVVGSTVVSGTVTLAQVGGLATIDLGEITQSGVGALNIQGPGIARTSLTNDVNGKLPAWITVNGGPSMADVSGNIVTYVAGYADIFRLGGKISNNPTADVRIINGGTTGNVSLTASGTTTINSLTQSASGAAVVNLGASGNTLRLGAPGVVAIPSGAGTLTMNNGVLTAGGTPDTATTLTVNAAQDAIINSPIGDNGVGMISLAKIGTASLTLGGVSNFSGPVTISGGTLEIAGTGQLGGGDYLANIINDATLRLNTSADQILAGVISGSGGLIKNNTGILTLAGVNTYSGDNIVDGGTLRAGTNNPFGGGSAVILADVAGAKLDLDGYSAAIGSLSGGGTTGGLVTFGENGFDGGTLTTGSDNTSTYFDGIISGGGNLIKVGTGTFTLTGANTFAGLTTIYGDTNSTLLLANPSGAALAGNISIGKPFGGGSGGTLQLGADNQLSSSATVTFGHAFGSQHAYFKLNGFNTEIGGLANGSDLGGEVLNGAATDSTLTLGGSGTYTFGPISGFHGTIADGGSGKLSIVKSGTGTQTFTGSNSYTGNTTVTGGTLSLAVASLADSSAVSIGSGAILDLTHGATDTINALFIDGVQQSPGTYKSATGGGAGTVLASLSGTGSLQVTTGPSITFAAWMSGYDFSAFPGADLTADGDADHDGISNVIEQVFGTAPNAATTGLTQTGATASSLTFKHPLSTNLASDVTYSYQWSSDLSEWKSSGQSNAGGTTATINAGAPVAGEVTVTTTISAGTAAKVFVRIVASQT